MSIQVWNGFHFWGLSPNQIHLTNLQHIFANICINTCEKITNDKSNTRRQYYRRPPTNWYVWEQIGSLDMQRFWRKATQIDKVWSLHLKRNIQINVNMSQRHGPLIRVNHKNTPRVRNPKRGELQRDGSRYTNSWYFLMFNWAFKTMLFSTRKKFSVTPIYPV